MKLIGITGGVGSGKSELLRYIKEHYNCRILLSDDAAKELEKPGGSLYEPLITLLEGYPTGRPLRGTGGAIIPGEMAARIFADKGLLAKVNALVHPAVRRYIEDEVEKEREKGTLDYFFLFSALLIECGYKEVVDEMWYIYCRQDVRRHRLEASRGYDREKTDRIMQNQLSEEEFRRNCDVVIDNSGDLVDAYRQIDERLKP